MGKGLRTVSDASSGAFDQVACADHGVADDAAAGCDGVGRGADGGVLHDAADVVLDEACHCVGWRQEWLKSE